MAKSKNVLHSSVSSEDGAMGVSVGGDDAGDRDERENDCAQLALVYTARSSLHGSLSSTLRYLHSVVYSEPYTAACLQLSMTNSACLSFYHFPSFFPHRREELQGSHLMAHLPGTPHIKDIVSKPGS